MALTTTQTMLKFLVTLFYLSFFITVTIKGYQVFDMYVVQVDLHNRVYNFGWFLIGLIPYLGAFIGSLWLLANNMSIEDEIPPMNHSAYWYSRRLNSGQVAEAETQVDMVVTLFPNLNSQKNFSNENTHSKEATNYKYPPEFPIWAGFRNRKATSAPALLYNPYNPKVNSAKAVMCCAKFEVDPQFITMRIEDLAGFEDLWLKVNQEVVLPLAAAAELPNPSNLASSCDVPKGILLVGEEGSGKTSIVYCIMNEMKFLVPELDIKLYKVDGANCFASFIDTGSTFRELFHFAQEKSAVGIIVIDNIHRLFDRSVSIFLSEMSSVPKGKILVIATTTKKELLHERLVSTDEPGTFDYEYHFHLPEFWERVAILKKHFSKRECPMKEYDITQLARLTENYTPGELEKVAIRINAKMVDYYNKRYTKPEKSDLQSQQSCPPISQIARRQIFLEFDKYNRQRKSRKLPSSSRVKSGCSESIVGDSNTEVQVAAVPAQVASGSNLLNIAATFHENDPDDEEDPTPEDDDDEFPVSVSER